MKIKKSPIPMITCSGGTGGAVLLAFLKLYFWTIDAGISPFDRGGSTGKFRKRKLIALGDLRKALVALAREVAMNPIMYIIMKERLKTIEGAPHNDEPTGNWVLAILEQAFNSDIIAAIRAIERELGVSPRHHVWPVSLDLANIKPITADGVDDLSHQGQIKDLISDSAAEVSFNLRLGSKTTQMFMSPNQRRIVDFMLMPDTEADPNAKYPIIHEGFRKAILKAGKDKGGFIIPQGSHYDSQIASLAVNGMIETHQAFSRYGGETFQILNIFDQPWQSEGNGPDEYIGSVLDRLQAKHIDVAIVNDPSNIPAWVLDVNYKRDGSAPLKGKKCTLAKKVIKGKFATWDANGKVSLNQAAVHAIYEHVRNRA